MSIGWLYLLMGALISNPLNMEFGRETKETSRNWQVINDGVMGGRSRGVARLTETTLIFEGNISLENNGGFSSLKSPFTSWPLEGKKYLVIRYRNSGQPMAFTLEKSRFWFRPYYKKQLVSTSGEWIEERIPLTDFYAYRIGQNQNKRLSDKELNSIIRIGFITDGKKEGAFSFEVDYVRFE